MKKTMEANAERVEVVRRTGNVFAQLGRRDADDLIRKARVLNVINEVIEEKGLDQAAAAEAMGIDQADVSRLIHGKLTRFSLDRLMTFIDRLDVAIDFRQSRDADGHLIVKVQRHTYALT
jgi:predicted XRE-type DNA-binding protein